MTAKAVWKGGEKEKVTFFIDFLKLNAITEWFNAIAGRDWHAVCITDQPVLFSSSSILKEVKLMLVLSRKAGEKLMIGDDVVLTINRISGNRVAIGIEAPRNVRIVRGELQKNQVAPSGSTPNTAPMGEASIAVASKAEA